MLAPLHGSDRLPGQRGLLHPGFQRNGLVAGHDYSSDWTPLLAGLSPAGMAASLPAPNPDLILSHHPARAIARRLPPSVELRSLPVAGWSDSTSVTHPLRSSPITGPSLLLRGSPPLSGASVLSASRLEPLGPFPLASPARFSRSVPEPGRASRCLHAGRVGNTPSA